MSIAACGLSLVAASRDYSVLWCVGFSLWWLLLLRAWTVGEHASVVWCVCSVVVCVCSVAVVCVLSSCGVCAQ